MSALITYKIIALNKKKQTVSDYIKLTDLSTTFQSSCVQSKQMLQKDIMTHIFILYTKPRLHVFTY